jgi:hypothetical protein
MLLDVAKTQHVLGGIVADCPFWTLSVDRQRAAILKKMGITRAAVWIQLQPLKLRGKLYERATLRLRDDLAWPTDHVRIRRKRTSRL